MTQVLFFPVADVNAKLSTVLRIVQRAQENKEKLFILVPDDAGRKFLDTFLWKAPEEGFFPHPTPLLDLGTIQPDAASTLLNLCPSTPKLHPGLKLIYELEDQTSQEKIQLSRLRYDTYKRSGVAIAID